MKPKDYIKEPLYSKRQRREMFLNTVGEIQVRLELGAAGFDQDVDLVHPGGMLSWRA